MHFQISFVVVAAISCTFTQLGCSGTKAQGGSTGIGASGGAQGSTATGGSNDAATGGSNSLGGNPSSAGASAQGGTVNSGGSGNQGGTVATTGGKTSVVSAGNPNGNCAIPAAAQAESVANPTTVVGTGTAGSCTSAAFIAAVAKGGIITFNCGTSPATIQMTDTAKVFNQVNGANNQKVVIDGGNLVTLDGGGAHRILYQNTCDQSLVWATAACQSQSFPQLTVQNITFKNALGSASEVDKNSVMGGGAIYVEGGTFKAYNVIVSNSAESSPAGELAQDLAGGGVYAFELTAPAYIVNSTFQGNSGTNGGALGSIAVSYTILNSLFANNSATGLGMNPAQAGTTGGGLGGAIYNDGNSYTLSICGTVFTSNVANELGSGSIFQVVDDLNGDLVISDSSFSGNSNVGSVQSEAHSSIYVEARDKSGNAGITITNTLFN